MRSKYESINLFNDNKLQRKKKYLVYNIKLMLSINQNMKKTPVNVMLREYSKDATEKFECPYMHYCHSSMPALSSNLRLPKTF